MKDMTNHAITFINFDWKSQPSPKEWQAALAPFGVFVYQDPDCEGSDSYGYIFSNKKLTREEIAEATSKHYGYEDD